MSVHVLSWAWKVEVGDAGAKLVLLKLADQANDVGEAWPSKATLARDTEMSERTVRRKVELLVDRGLLAVEPRELAGRQTSNLYRVLRGDNVTPLNLGSRGDTGDTPGGDRAVSPELSEEPLRSNERASASSTTGDKGGDHHADVYRALVAECFPAGQELTRRAKQQTALAAANILSGGGTGAMVAAVKRAYQAHPSYSKCALTPMALSNRWSELAPVAMVVPCEECGIAGGRHSVDCARIAA